MKQYKHIAYFLLNLLLLSGAANEAWATDVTYHILTLPIDNDIYHMKDEISGKRLEAFKVTVTGQSRLELPAAYKSPLVGSFTYYAAADVTQSGSAVKLFDATNNQNKAFYYTINGGASAVAEGTTLSGTKADYYVVYTYNASNTIAQLNGSVKYNIKAIGYDKGKEVEKGFFAYNRGRNNRPAVLPKGKVDPEMLASEDFMKVDVSGTSVGPYWSSGDNKNKEAITGSKFHFMFEFVGNDPYNIIIRTAYAKDSTYIEKNDNSSEFVYKFYKEGSLFANGTANTYFASDEHRHYNYPYNSSLAENPTNLTVGDGTGWDARTGYYHGQKGTMWNSFALLKNSESTYLFMATRTVGGDGKTPDAPYFLKEANTCNNLVINQVALDNATNNLTIEGIYPIKKLTFKIATPFYKVSPTADHIISVSDQISQYTVENDVIETKYLPDGLKRKYIEFNGKFYKDAACTQEITNFSQADYDNTEGYKVYVGYDVAPGAPKFLSPSASPTTATWYELTDDGSVQESGRKIKNNSGTYKNNGANGEYVKESEFALVGDPYELKVLYREGSNYVTLSDHDTWEMPSDNTSGSFLLREYKGTGYWSWVAGHVSADVAYSSNLTITPNTDKNAQTVILNISGLNTSKYYGITAGGDVSQIVSVTPELNNVKKVTGTTMTVVVKIAENTSGANKTMTLTLQQYDNAEGSKPSESPANPSVITITQGTETSEFAGNTVEYSTTSSTRVKVLELPKLTYTYNIVDKSGRIAVKASAEQTIFSALSLESIPSIIVSPFILDETVTFYDNNYVDGDGRETLLSVITETPAEADDIYVTYTTTQLINKPIKLSEDQEFNVVLNGQYIYFDGSSISTKTAPTPAELQDKNFLWKLRNRDPYAMLIDNLGAREVLPDVEHHVAGQTEDVWVYSDAGVRTQESRQKGAWVDVASIVNEGALSFTTVRDDAQRFVAKASTNTGVYEVMLATGTGVDASTTYYNIGRPTENTVKIYYNNTESGGYAHGNDVLKFRLEQTIGYTYHLIDMSKHELLTLTSQNPDLALPADYQSPLVAQYHFYDQDNITKSGDEWTVNPSATELTSLNSLDATFTGPTEGDYGAEYAGADAAHKHDDATTVDDISAKAKKLGVTGNHYYKIGDAYYHVNVSKAFYTHVYVTYEANNLVSFNNSSPYTLKFLEPFADGYFLEDGADKLTPEKHQAVYPYTNGDGNLNIYSEESKTEQFGGGSSTRPRWIWYFDTSNNKPDPYHVRIRARSTISYSGVSHPTYLTTYAVHFNQDTEKPKQERIVTGGTLPGISSTAPVEYMILGAQGAYKLMTTDPVAADLDGDGNATGTGENERRKVTSLEQYWKTYNMAKLHVLGVSASTDDYSEDASTWVVPKVDDPETTSADESTYRSTLEARGWHSYDAYANATRWNGFNNVSSGHEKKVVEKLEHWYQTFDMGNGTFDIENASIPPVLVLLDLHGWEIMRLPLPTTNYPEGTTELAALRAYDSPMVKEYKFYSNATKASGCHKYSLRMQNGAERDQIKKVDGEHYTSKSLAVLPPLTATGVMSGNEFNDQYVTYTVKEEYAKSYSYDYSTGTETASKYLVLQASRFLRDLGTEGSSYNSKPIYEASNPTGGNVYDVILDPQQNTVQHESTSVDDNTDGVIDDINLWYVQPNQSIDKEMGIKYASTTGNTGEPWTEAETKKYYHDNGKDGFDPYNLQLKNANTSKFATSHITSTRLHDGIMIGDYTGSGSENITLVAEDTTYPDPMASTGSVGYDHTNIAMTNQTFMAVSDANGNMQLMPRFDHTKRFNLVNNEANSFCTLKDPENHAKASAEDNSSMGSQTTFFVRPERLEYHIIDNEGKESLRYKRAGDEYPAVTAHFQSPIAKDFTYYTGFAESGSAEACTEGEWTAATGDFKRTATSADQITTLKNLLPTAGTYYFRIGKNSFTYEKVTVTKGLLEKKIEGALAAETLDGNVYVRYEYDAGADHDADQILGGKWFTVQLANKDLKSSETRIVSAVGETQGTNVNLFQGESKPTPIEADDPLWQWKFLAAPADSSSEYYVAPDPYDVQLFNRYANYAATLAEPSPMAVGIKVPNANNGANHFALLSHPDGGYALAVAGKTSDFYTYDFLNGANMTTSVAATTATEASFTQKTGIITAGSQLTLNNDVKHDFEYRVINNASKFAVSATQDDGAAEAHGFAPYLPDAAQTPLLRMKDYKYYGSATESISGSYTVEPNTKLYTLYGLYDDVVYVRYDAYHVDSTEFKIPNKKTIVDSHVAKDPTSVDVSLNINGELPYNIIWENNNMMQSTDDAAISDGGDQTLSGNKQYIWYITGNDPYALKIKHKGGNYVDGDASMVAEGSAKEFMLLKKSGYDYGILQETAGTNKLSGFGQTMVAGDPTKFIIFGLSVHDLIYRLIIAKTCTNKEIEKDKAHTIELDPSKYVDIPYMTAVSGTPGTKRIYGSTQRDLTSVNTGEGTHYAGEKYQLGEIVTWGGEGHTYSHDAGPVSIGDDLTVPNVFNRPNCTFEFYIAGIFDGSTGSAIDALESKYKGLKLDKLMSDADLIDETVVVNIVYSFNQELATNNGMDFVRSTEDKCWYTFETSGDVPYLAHYTNAWGLQSMAGRETRYTNDYLWTPVGDVYGFKLYNRYMIKNSDGSDKVMTFDGTISEGKNLAVAKPGSIVDTKTYTSGNEVFELLTGDNPNSGYFRVHPVINNSGDQYYVWRDAADGNYAKLSTTPCDWTFGLDMSLMEPYYERAGYVGGLKDSGKTAYENAVSSGTIMDIQHVVYDDANIINFTPGYYRLHNQPGVSGINPVRYASGYLHDIEKTAVSGGIPMHFYSRASVGTTFGGTEGLGSGFTETIATRGDIPVPATEEDPSTIFYINGAVTSNKTISEATMSTQGLNVLGNKMTTETGTTFTFIDIGGAVFLITDVLTPASRNYFSFDQTSNIYDVKFAHEVPTDDAKWCLQPVQKTATAGNGEMPLNINTNQGGDGYYYATFCAPFDVLLPGDVVKEEVTTKSYYAYTCDKWNDKNLHPKKVPAVGETYKAGKFVPAGTPVIIRTNDETGTMTLTLPNTTTSTALSCVFTGEYLEKKLDASNPARDVFTLGLPMTSDVDKDGDYVTSGGLTAPRPEFATNGVGFYINATPNKEVDPLKALWKRNNLYVLHNKIYYRAEEDSEEYPAPQRRGPEFVPIIFDDEEEEQDEELTPNGTREIVGDGCVYDLMGRKVATREQVENGSWKQRVATGIYIINGKKIRR